MLDIDTLSEYQDYFVQIRNSKTDEVIEGLINNDGMSYQSAAIIDDSFSAGSLEGFVRGLGTGAANGIPIAGPIIGNMIRRNFKTIASTYEGYSGASKNDFSVQMHIFPGHETYNSLLNKIHKYTQPDVENYFMYSYLYEPGDAAELLKRKDPFKGNLIQVSVGDWFEASGLFCSSVNYQFSKYMDDEGKPLYLVVDLSFRPYKVLNAQELASWIKK